MNSAAAEAKRLRRQMADDPHRPRYHFTPPANWMNDPNGIIEWDGKYHLFYQHNPYAAVWDNMHWGHAVSSDLLHWTDLPVALSPTADGPDEDGCWSGCAVDDNGVPTILYTGVRGDWTLPHNQRVCLATGNVDLTSWEKYAGNAIIAHPPDGLRVAGFRDPFVWREEDCWYMAIGAGIQDVGGAALLYRSRDLYRWEYLHPMCVGDKHDETGLWTGSVWEVPQLHCLGDKHVLLATVWDNDPLYSVYFTGSYRNRRFIPETVQKLDFGDRHYYAAHAILDSQDRHIMWGFIGESRSTEAQQAAGWSGAMALPRELALRDDGKLAIRPVQETEMLRGEHQRLTKMELTAASGDMRIDLPGDALEIAAEIDPADAEECGIKVRCSPDGQEETIVFYDRARKRLGVDRRRSTLVQRGGVSPGLQEGAFELAPGEALRLRVFVDCSVIEVFANDYACLTSRVYPSRSDSTGVRVYSRGATRINSLDIWRLSSIWASA